jgi:Thioredoxin reductase
MAVVFAVIVFFACVSQSSQDQDSYKVVVIGSGPAGLTAGMYTARANQKTLLFEGQQPGGLLTSTPAIENWPGIKKISGYDLMAQLRDHALHSGCKIVSDVVVAVDLATRPYKITGRSGRVYKADALIIAMGVKRDELGCPGEAMYRGKGVSACATCDAPFFKDKKVIVVGGGSTALTEASHLSYFASGVEMIIRGDHFKTSDPIKQSVQDNSSIKIRFNTRVVEIKGDGKQVTSVILEDKKTNQQSTLEVSGVFVAIGYSPNTQIFGGQLDIDSYGYLKVQGSKASKEGVFGAGDIIHSEYQQAIVAAGDGCRAALDCIAYLEDRG